MGWGSRPKTRDGGRACRPRWGHCPLVHDGEAAPTERFRPSLSQSRSPGRGGRGVGPPEVSGPSPNSHPRSLWPNHAGVSGLLLGTFCLDLQEVVITPPVFTGRGIPSASVKLKKGNRTGSGVGGPHGGPYAPPLYVRYTRGGRGCAYGPRRREEAFLRTQQQAQPDSDFPAVDFVPSAPQHPPLSPPPYRNGPLLCLLDLPALSCSPPKTFPPAKVTGCSKVDIRHRAQTGREPRAAGLPHLPATRSPEAWPDAPWLVPTSGCTGTGRSCITSGA